ncbi:LacI family transcriptional regulator [Humibacter sp. BT305]|nr:LacI family transcriptional regulator [Humibacter sp. BT305]
MVPRPSRPTVQDVARRAGVGVGTVSRVLNDLPNVAEATKRRVQTAIDELGYRRNSAASALRRGTGITIGLLVDDLADPFYSLVHRAVEDAALENDWALLALSTAGDGERARRQIAGLASRGVDGLLVMLPEGSREADVLHGVEAGTAVVYLDRPPVSADADTVLADNRAGARLGVEHLIARGHRRIGCLADRAGIWTSRERVEGYREALRAAGIRPDDALVHSRVGPHAEAGGVIERMLRLPDPPTALFTANNRVTAAALRALAADRIRLDIVGFDDLELADLLDPPLTVVEQDAERLGATAALRLQQRLAGDRGPATHDVVVPRLLVRTP